MERGVLMGKKVIMFTNTMTAGGAERVMTNMVNFMVDDALFEKIDFSLLTTARGEDFYQLNERVTRRYLDHKVRALPTLLKPFRFFQRLISLRKLIREEVPTSIISFLENVNLLNILACLGTETNSIISIRNDPRKNEIGVVLSILRKFLYPLAGLLVVQTQEVEKWSMENNLNKNTVVIPNSVKIPEESWAQENKSDVFRFVAAGRLVEQKGFDLLIKAAEKLSQKGLSFQVDIFGKGALKKKLQSMIQENSLNEIVSLKGVTKELNKELLDSDTFILSSRYEGFPNVLLEAMSLGVPSISFNCKSGPSDIISNEEDGLLVNDGDIDSLAIAMEKMIKETTRREEMGLKARQNMKRYEISRIMEIWKRYL